MGVRPAGSDPFHGCLVLTRIGLVEGSRAQLGAFRRLSLHARSHQIGLLGSALGDDEGQSSIDEGVAFADVAAYRNLHRQRRLALVELGVDLADVDRGKATDIAAETLGGREVVAAIDGNGDARGRRRRLLLVDRGNSLTLPCANVRIADTWLSVTLRSVQLATSSAIAGLPISRAAQRDMAIDGLGMATPKWRWAAILRRSFYSTAAVASQPVRFACTKGARRRERPPPAPRVAASSNRSFFCCVRSG